MFGNIASDNLLTAGWALNKYGVTSQSARPNSRPNSARLPEAQCQRCRSNYWLNTHPSKLRSAYPVLSSIICKATSTIIK